MKLNLGLENLLNASDDIVPYYPPGTIPLTDAAVAEEGLIQMLKDWWAERKKRQQAAKLQKSKLEFKSYASKMFTDYESVVLQETRDVVMAYPIEDLIKHFTNLNIITTVLFEHDVRKDKSKTDVDAVVLKADKIRSISRTSNGLLAYVYPMKKQFKYAGSGWSKRQTVEELRKILDVADDQTWRFYEQTDAMINTLNAYLAELPDEDRRRFFGIGSWWLSSIEWLCNCIAKCEDYTFTSMYSIYKAT
jgi:hypothetical protein